jgi:glutathione S-transferase
MVTPVLWHFQGSHFNEKVRWALDFKEIPHRRRALGGSYLPRAWWRTGRATLPVLLFEGRAVGDSTHIIELLERLRPDPPLYPEGEPERRRALALEDFLDEELGHPIRTAALHEPLLHEPEFCADFWSLGLRPGARRLFRIGFPLMQAFYRLRHGIDDASAEEGRRKVRVALDRIEAELLPSGYLVGDRFSVADLTAASLLGPVVQPPELEYPLPLPLPRSLLDYRASLARHPVFEWVSEMYRRHRGKSAEVSG